MRPASALVIPSLVTRQFSADAVGDAQLFWAGDTSLVSSFLSIAPSLSGQDLATAATSALASEGDELNHKGVLDTIFQDVVSEDIRAANATLVDHGTFQFVVDGLNDLATNGAGFTSDQVLSSIAMINTVRCNNVLPAIDIYLRLAVKFSGKQSPNVAIRPSNCP